MHLANRVSAICLLIILCCTSFHGQRAARRQNNASQIPLETQIRILRAEDTRDWNEKDLGALLKNEDANIRRRAALAAGRIGDERAVASLVELMQKDSTTSVRAMAAFALGEIESNKSSDALIAVLQNEQARDERARAVEALGKIAAALPKEEAARGKQFGAVILKTLEFEASKRSLSDEHLILLGLTATLRARPENAGATVAKFLNYSNERIREDALNTLVRLRAKEALPQVRELLTNDKDPVVRANAARVLGAAEDKESFVVLLDHAMKDEDVRVRVSCIRALGSLKDSRAVKPLVQQGDLLLKLNSIRGQIHIDTQNELLEVATSLGRLSEKKTNAESLKVLLAMRDKLNHAPEVEIALARVAPSIYVTTFWHQSVAHHRIPESVSVLSWKMIASHAQGLGEIANLEQNPNVAMREEAGKEFLRLLNFHPSALAVPDVLRAYAAFKPNDLDEVLRAYLKVNDVIVRSTAAELLGELPPDKQRTDALIAALPLALQDEMNDAALAILDALAKQKNTEANATIKSALDSKDHLIRRRAVALLKANGVGDFSPRIGTVQTQFTDVDYRRALSRHNGQVRAIVETVKGSFTIEFLPDDAPLTVDNFIQLARKKFFDGQTIPRVVPNFVVQAGDPRGDTNGGPGYQIRCEINEVSYERGAVGMALSGKDTGGSQWFVTHSPQPHLDGGYTVFGRVVEGMNVVDDIARGTRIIKVRVVENVRRK